MVEILNMTISNAEPKSKLQSVRSGAGAGSAMSLDTIEPDEWFMYSNAELVLGTHLHQLVSLTCKLLFVVFVVKLLNSYLCALECIVVTHICFISSCFSLFCFFD